MHLCTQPSEFENLGFAHEKRAPIIWGCIRIQPLHTAMRQILIQPNDSSIPLVVIEPSIGKNILNLPGYLWALICRGATRFFRGLRLLYGLFAKSSTMGACARLAEYTRQLVDMVAQVILGDIDLDAAILGYVFVA